MKPGPLICAIGVSHRDVELACLWLRWVAFLCGRDGGSNRGSTLLICTTKSITIEQDMKLVEAILDLKETGFKPYAAQLEDEDESGYPKSASHLFLRTMEEAERRFPGSPVLWCEADTVPMKPTWFKEIAAEYAECGKPFLGVNAGRNVRQLSGNAVYPANWRKVAPSIANVLNAPDFKLWGVGKGQPWDVYCREETTPLMAESKLMHHVWKNRDPRTTRLETIPARTCIFHQDKTGAIIRAIAALKYPQFMATLETKRRFFFMNGHQSRLDAKGIKIRFSYSKFTSGGHRSAVCSDELNDEEAALLTAVVGKYGVSEISEEEFLKVTGRETKSLPPAKIRRIAKESQEIQLSHPSVFVMLGRYGDVMNLLPLMKAEADAGRRPTLVISKEFETILDGVSYCDRIVWDGAYDQLDAALRWLRRDKGIHAPVIAQVHRHPFDRARLTESYQIEAWRMAGHLDDFATRGPLVFDRRDKAREMRLSKLVGKEKPVVLVATNSISSPLPPGLESKLIWVVGDAYPKCHVIHLSQVKAERIYDMLGLFDGARLLVTVDTVFVHLARASRVPVVAILNDGWRGSILHEGCTTIRYKDVMEDLSVLRNALPTEDFVMTEKTGPNVPQPPVPVEPEAKPGPRVLHVADVFGKDARHHVAQASWAAVYADGVQPVHVKKYHRDAKSALGDPRELPFLKDILMEGLSRNSNDSDVIIWTNSDIGFVPSKFDAMVAHVREHGAASMRRTESNGQHHMGRDLFAFTAKWLIDNWDEIPDYVIGVPVFDLGLVAMIRLKAGITTPLTTKNVGIDMAPADMEPGLALHQSHVSEWLVRSHHTLPAARHNHDLFLKWARTYAPATKFTKGGNLQ